MFRVNWTRTQVFALLPPGGLRPLVTYANPEDRADISQVGQVWGGQGAQGARSLLGHLGY